MNVQERQAIERRIIAQLIDTALAAGYLVSVFDGEEWAIRFCSNKDAIMKEMFATDEESLSFYSAEKVEGKRRCMGVVYLVYGNDGYDVICDHSDNPVTNELVKPATELADEIEASL
jgi:hypothetical protein